MVNKKTIIAGIFVAFAILAISLYVGQSTQAPESSTPNAKAPPTMSNETLSTISLETALTQSPEDIQTLELSESDGSIVCDKPPKDNKYGGISGSVDKPPRGTTITEPQTGNRVTATGACGTYWYIAGWWFNASEMVNLPSDTIMYGTSPYTTSGGPGGSTQPSVEATPGDDGSDEGNPGDGDGNNDPIVPVPEVATLTLVTVGLFVFVAWRIKRK